MQLPMCGCVCVFPLGLQSIMLATRASRAHGSIELFTMIGFYMPSLLLLFVPLCSLVGVLIRFSMWFVLCLHV
jgi:lipopolysaccharide export LptBFGC system permease protein LptF